MAYPLDGIVVVSLEHAIAAPFATRQLADLGARVIKIEPLHGDFARTYDQRVRGLSSHFVWCNRSKESVGLDLKSETGQRALGALVAKADVLVQNLAPGAAAGLGVSYADLESKYPRLIVCDISGYGRGGPDQDRKAYDLLIQSESGFLSVTGTPDEVVKAGCPVADIAAGMYAYSNILGALIERNQTGRGKQIDISMLESLAEWMGFPLYYAFEGAAPPTRNGAHHATIYPYGPFHTAEGDVFLAVQNEREWASFCQSVLGRPEMATDPRFSPNSARSANRNELEPLIEGALKRLSISEAMTMLDNANIANARVNDLAGLWKHGPLRARQRWREVMTPAGRIPALLPPGQTDAVMNPVPSVGEHTESIFAELGLKSPCT